MESVSVVDEVLCAYRLHHGNLSLEIKEDGYRESVDIGSAKALTTDGNEKARAK